MHKIIYEVIFLYIFFEYLNSVLWKENLHYGILLSGVYFTWGVVKILVFAFDLFLVDFHGLTK